MLASISLSGTLGILALTTTLQLNGQPLTVPAPISLAQLVDRLGYTGKRIAVECNGEIVPRSRYGETTMADGDQLEIVVAVGGG